MRNSDKIDFVVTWVDGSGPEWLKSRVKYCTPDDYDSANDDMDFYVAKKQLIAFFESEYPERSSFEKR